MSYAVTILGVDPYSGPTPGTAGFAKAPPQFVGVDPVDANNWRANSQGAHARATNRAKLLRAIGDGVNYIACAPRMHFCVHYPEAHAYASATDADPLYRWETYDEHDNERALAFRALRIPRSAGSGFSVMHLHDSPSISSPYFDAGSTVSTGTQSPVANAPAQFSLFRGSAGSGRSTQGLSVRNGARILDLVVGSERRSLIDLATERGVPQHGPQEGAPIAGDTFLERARAALHHCRQKGLGVAFCWSAQLPETATPSSSGKSGIVTASTSYVNVLDPSHTSRTASSPGFITPAYRCARGEETNSKRVRVECYAYGYTSTGTAEVKFIGPTGFASNETTLTLTTTRALVGSASTYVDLDASATDAEATAATNKIDIHLRKNTSGTAYLLGFYGLIRYA